MQPSAAGDLVLDSGEVLDRFWRQRGRGVTRAKWPPRLAVLSGAENAAARRKTAETIRGRAPQRSPALAIRLAMYVRAVAARIANLGGATWPAVGSSVCKRVLEL
jgi:hypothetical protein